MPKRLWEYEIRDYLHLRPILHLAKTARYRSIDKRYFRLPPDFGDETAVRRSIAGKRVLVTVAFDDPEAIAWQSRLVRKFVDTERHLVADNSARDRMARAICRVAEAQGCDYVRLPPNPWTGKNPSRSHGLAMNWIWQRIIRVAEPEAFGFLDADMFPTAACDPFTPLEKHDFYGDKRWAGNRWFLWAGYCFFSFAKIADKPLDFGLDWFIGLDTGGGNWEVLYRHIDPATLPDRLIRHVAALSDLDPAEAGFEWRGDWLHEIGLAGNMAMKGRKREALKALLAPLLDDGPWPYG